MELSLAVYNDLAQLLRLLHLPRGILLAHLLQRIHHLLRLALVDRTDGATVFGIGIFDEIEAILTVLVVQRVAGLHVFQLHGATDIAGHQLVHLDARGTCTAEETADTFAAAAIGVLQIVALLHTTGHHLEILHFSDMRLHSRLEEIEARRTVGRRHHLLAACIVHSGHFVHKRHHVAQEFHQSAHAHILHGTDTEYGEHASGSQTLTDALTHFVLGERLALEELLHQRFVVLGCSLYKGFVHLHCLILLRIGNFLDGGRTAFRTP